MNKRVSFLQKALGIFLVLGSLNSAHANIVYSQNFESGLGSGETSFGAFTINNSNTALNNGTQMMGHAQNYTDNEYSYFQFTLNLVGVRNSMMQFDYAALIENYYDGFNVTANNNLLTPLSGMSYENQGYSHNAQLGKITFDSNAQLTQGTALFDLSAFDGQMLNVRMQFGSDSEIRKAGINLDNILVTGQVPEPSTPALLALGLGIVVWRKFVGKIIL